MNRKWIGAFLGLVVLLVGVGFSAAAVAVSGYGSIGVYFILTPVALALIIVSAARFFTRTRWPLFAMGLGTALMPGIAIVIVFLIFSALFLGVLG